MCFVPLCLCICPATGQMLYCVPFFLSFFPSYIYIFQALPLLLLLLHRIQEDLNPKTPQHRQGEVVLIILPRLDTWNASRTTPPALEEMSPMDAANLCLAEKKEHSIPSNVQLVTAIVTSTAKNTTVPPPLQLPPASMNHHHHQQHHHHWTTTAMVQPVKMGFGGGGAGSASSALTDSSSEELNFNTYQSTSVPPPPQFVLAKKLYRTKFTQEQKDKMLAFAEKLGWRIPREDDTEVPPFPTFL